ETNAAGRHHVALDGQSMRPRPGKHALAIRAGEIDAGQSLTAAVGGAHEAKRGVVESQRGPAALVTAEGQRRHVAPPLGELVRVVALELGRAHGAHGRRAARRRLRGGRMPRAVRRLAAFLPAEGEHGRAHVARVKLQLVVVAVLDLVGDAHAQRLAARPAPGALRALGADHVAAVCAETVEKARRGWAMPHWRHHLEEAVADGEQRVLEPVLAHARVAIAHLEAEHLVEGVHDRSELAGHQADLPHAKVHGRWHGMPPSPMRVMRLSDVRVEPRSTRTSATSWTPLTLSSPDPLSLTDGDRSSQAARILAHHPP